MPQWYYEKKELKNTPSYIAGLDYETETRYRREGARYFYKKIKFDKFREYNKKILIHTLDKTFPFL